MRGRNICLPARLSGSTVGAASSNVSSNCRGSCSLIPCRSRVEIGISRTEDGAEVADEEVSSSSKEGVQGVSVAADSLSAREEEVAREGEVVRDFGNWAQGLLRRSRFSRLAFKSGDEDEVGDLRSLVLLENIC